MRGMLWTAGLVDSFRAVWTCSCLDMIWGRAEAKKRCSERITKKKNVCEGGLPGIICTQECLVLFVRNSEKEIRRKCRMYYISEFRVSTINCATTDTYYEGSLLCEFEYAIPSPWIHSFTHLTIEQIFLECLWFIDSLIQSSNGEISPSHYMHHMVLILPKC